MLVTPIGTAPATAQAERTANLRVQARKLEAAFLTEMLGHAGLGTAPASFGGGIGEEHFASFLREAQATAIVAKGGVGLAEQLFQALSRHDDAGQ